MAYLSKEATKEIRDNLKKAFPDFKFSVQNDRYNAIRVAIMEAPVRFHADDYAQINHYHPHFYQNEDILRKIITIVNEKNFDNSDIMTDYFSVGYYVSISQGKWDKPFVLKA